MLFKRIKKVKFGEVLKIVEPALMNSIHSSKLHVYFFEEKMCPLVDHEQLLKLGDKLQFIEYYIDDKNVIHRREFGYTV